MQNVCWMKYVAGVQDKTKVHKNFVLKFFFKHSAFVLPLTTFTVSS